MLWFGGRCRAGTTAIRFLLRIHQRHNVAGQKVVLRIVEHRQMVLQDGRRRTEDVGGSDGSIYQCTHSHRTAIIADDHDIVRRGLRGILEASGTCKIVAEAADGLTAAQLVEKHRPGILVLDLNMPRLHGVEVLRQVRTASPQTRVIVLSMHNDESYVIEALRGGAMAYILKGSESLEIGRALTEVLAGRRFLSAPLSEWAMFVPPRPVESAGTWRRVRYRKRWQ